MSALSRQPSSRHGFLNFECLNIEDDSSRPASRSDSGQRFRGGKPTSPARRFNSIAYRSSRTAKSHNRPGSAAIVLTSKPKHRASFSTGHVAHREPQSPPDRSPFMSRSPGSPAQTTLLFISDPLIRVLPYLVAIPRKNPHVFSKSPRTAFDTPRYGMQPTITILHLIIVEYGQERGLSEIARDE